MGGSTIIIYYTPLLVMIGGLWGVHTIIIYNTPLLVMIRGLWGVHTIIIYYTPLLVMIMGSNPHYILSPSSSYIDGSITLNYPNHIIPLH